MRIYDILKKFFIVLIAFTILGLISMIPLGKYKKAYMKKRQQYRSAPQIHVDATELYVEAVMDGEEDVSDGVKARAPRKYYLPFLQDEATLENKKVVKIRKYDKPLFVRDKNNPKILVPYRKKYFWQ